MTHHYESEWGTALAVAHLAPKTCMVPVRSATLIAIAAEIERLRAAAQPAPAPSVKPHDPRWVCLEGMNADELAAYDYGCAGANAAILAVLDGKDTGAGVANEPWESIRRRLLALVAATVQSAPAAVPAGWQLVPVEPTQEMVDEGDNTCAWPVHSGWNSRDVWSAMLAAAPAPATGGEHE